MICDAKVGQKTIFYQTRKSEKPNEPDIRFPVVYLDQGTGDYFLNQCLDYIELKNHVVQRTNLEFVISLCDNKGKFIAKDAKKDWKKVLPSLTNADLEHIKRCRHHLISSKELKDEESKKKAALSCQRLSERYFTVNMLMRDDMNEFHNFKYMHRILKEMLDGNLNDNMFFSNTEHQESHTMSFSKVVFKFQNKYDDLKSDTIKKFDGKESVKLFRNYYPIADMKAFPVNTFVMTSNVAKIWQFLVGFVIIVGFCFYE
jgi:hypothetical protein